MGSSFGLVLAGIFMVHLESTLIPKLTQHMNFLKRFFDGTVLIIKETSMVHVLSL